MPEADISVPVPLRVEVEVVLGPRVLITPRIEIADARGVTTVVGPSGAGKTTLLRVLAGLVRPRGGQVMFAGQIWVDRGAFVPPHRRPVSLVSQRDALFPHLTVRGNIAYGAAAADVEPILERLELRELADRMPDSLSGGQRKRVAVGRALARRSKLFLMDEPFGSLDRRARQELRGLVLRDLATRGIPVILVTHDPEEALSVADRAIAIRDGKVRMIGPAREVLASEDSVR